MSSEFKQGKTIVTMVIATILLIHGIGIWFAKTWLLRWYADLVESLQDPVALASARALQSWFVMNQETFFNNQLLNFAIIIFLCIMLFIGFNWLRWIWAIHWIVRGLLGATACTLAWIYINQFNPLIVIGLLVSILYLFCGLTMVCSAKVSNYMHSLRRPSHRFY